MEAVTLHRELIASRTPEGRARRIIRQFGGGRCECGHVRTLHVTAYTLDGHGPCQRDCPCQAFRPAQRRAL